MKDSVVYNCPDNAQIWIEISNVWSRRSLKTVLSDEGDTILFALQNKCECNLLDEDGLMIEEITSDTLDTVDLRVYAWISSTIAEHIDFLLGSLRTKSET